MKKFLLIGSVVALIALWGYSLMAGDIEWNNTKIANLEYGILKPLTQFSRTNYADTTAKNVSVDSVQHSRSYKDTRGSIYGMILNSTLVTVDDDTAHSYWILEGAAQDSTADWTPIDTVRTVTLSDSADAYTDTTIIPNPRYNYYRYAFASTNPTASTDYGVIWKATLIGQPEDFWLRGNTDRDTSQLIYLPADYNYWTLWYKAQRKDSIKMHIRALVSYDKTHWTQADSIAPTAGYVADSLVHFRILTLPKAMWAKVQLADDTASGRADYELANGDSSGFYGTLVRLQYIQGK